jgi:hypothetical protein
MGEWQTSVSHVSIVRLRIGARDLDFSGRVRYPRQA